MSLCISLVELCSDTTASVQSRTTLISDVKVTDIEIVKKRTLRSKDYNSKYPSEMPFYMYGSLDELHIDLGGQTAVQTPCARPVVQHACVRHQERPVARQWVGAHPLPSGVFQRAKPSS